MWVPNRHHEYSLIWSWKGITLLSLIWQLPCWFWDYLETFLGSTFTCSSHASCPNLWNSNEIWYWLVTCYLPEGQIAFLKFLSIMVQCNPGSFPKPPWTWCLKIKWVMRYSNLFPQTFVSETSNFVRLPMSLISCTCRIFFIC